MNGPANTGKGFLPLDIAGVMNTGIEEWFASYSDPVPSVFFYEIRDKLTRCFSENKPDASAKPDLHQIWLANYKIVFLLSDYYFKYSMLIAAEKQGYAGLVTDVKMDFDTARELYRKTIFSNVRIQRRPFPKNLVDRYRFIRQNKFDPGAFYPGFNDRRKNYIIGDRDRAEIKFYLEENGIDPYFINPTLLLSDGGKNLNSDQEEETKSIVDSFFSRIFASFPETKEAFDESVRRTIFEIIIDKYRHYFTFFDTLSEYSISGRDLIVCPCGNMLFRLFCCAWRRHGGTVTGFSHGNVYSYIYTPGDINNGSQLILDRYITCSKGETKLLEDSRKDFRNGLESRAVMETCRNSYYRTVFTSVRNGPAVDSVKKVMVVGFPYSFDVYNNMSYLHLEMSIVRTLKDAGFQVLYKAHPDSLSDASAFFTGMTDSVITDSFETVYNMADCVVFPIHYSTTFGFTLMTNRPIVIMESPLLTGWHPDVEGLIRKRCSSVKLSFNERSVFSFDREEFIRSIHESIKRTDQGIVETFAF
ncbi:MAG TPA: hypothetical protein DET40_19055 [Lentisphaeria bacterium]|nr:MAG: hypothetical protein A2X45_25310 [Lentisphaerae bacterium GWF2_50_93]HCE45646.1 hypothetical protein [Lentisphaeria bacterium]